VRDALAKLGRGGETPFNRTKKLHLNYGCPFLQNLTHTTQSCVTAQRGARITPKDAYEHYERWAALNNITGVVPYTTFGKRMSKAVQAIGGDIGRSNQRFYANVTLAPMGANGIPLLESKPDGEAAE
jgi:hypothetical protein